MDYKKAYEEALGWMRSIYPTLTGAEKEDAEHYFPELKESEDERTRRELVDFILYKAGNLLDEDTEHRYITYLERVKEQKPVQDKEEREYVRTLKSLIADFLRDKEEVDRGYYQDIYDWLDGRHIEQQPKQEWIEEDENKLDNICDYIAGKVNLANSAKKDAIAFLKSLRPQPKAKWMDEDKTNGWIGMNLERYLSCLQRLGTGNPQQPETINSKWFKEHCRLHPHWKPSDEQIRPLEYAIEYFKKKKNDTTYLESLYNDLKKL